MNETRLKLNARNIAILILMAIFFIADRILKITALNLVADASTSLIGQILVFKFTANPFVSFSIPLPQWFTIPLVLIIIGLLIFYIFYLIIKKKEYNLEATLLTVVLFGAISNILDRFIFGFVVDYLELKFFTIFNLADVLISAGALILIIHKTFTDDTGRQEKGDHHQSNLQPAGTNKKGS